MHQCFEIPDVAAKICSHCDKRSLAILGRTAKLFDCALDALWSGYHGEAGQISTLDLIKCFPREILTWRKPALTFSVPLEPHHWERFNFYVKRIRNFRLQIEGRPPVDRQVLDVLAWYAPPEGLLPNLESLSLYGEGLMIHARPFLSPTLQSVDIGVSKQEKSSFASRALPGLPTICPDITTLTLRFPSLFSRHLMPILPGFHHLRQLHLTHISAEYLPLIASLPKITNLVLDRVQDSKDALPSISAGTNNVLTHVDLTASPNHILTLFSGFSKCPLQHIALVLHGFSTESECTAIVRMVQDKCHTHSLRRFSIRRAVSPGDQLLSFIKFPNITHFCCSFFGPLSLDDSSISALAESWPNLVDLSLKTDSKHPPRLTTRSLTFLALHCPKLESIALEFDGTGKEHDGKQFPLAYGDVHTRSVRTLDVGYSPIGEPAPVAECLISLFPNLTSLLWSGAHTMVHPTGDLHRDRWLGVVNLVIHDRGRGE